MTQTEEAVAVMRRLHPYDRKDFPADLWIDRFRSVFVQNPIGTNVLALLAAQWHFFDRTLLTQEEQIQRQCFVDLLTYCGIVAPDTCDQLMQHLAASHPSQSKATPLQRTLAFLRSLGGLRTVRKDQPKVKG